MQTVPSSHPLLCLRLCSQRSEVGVRQEVQHFPEGRRSLSVTDWIDLHTSPERNTKEQVSEADPPPTCRYVCDLNLLLLGGFIVSLKEQHSMLIHVRCLFLCILLESSLPQKYLSACFSVAGLSYQRAIGPHFCFIGVKHCTKCIFELSKRAKCRWWANGEVEREMLVVWNTAPLKILFFGQCKPY